MQCAEGVKKNCTQKHRKDIIKETKKKWPPETGWILRSRNTPADG